MSGANVFGVGTFSVGSGKRFPGLVVDDVVLDLRPVLGPGVSTLELLEDWQRSLVLLREVRGGNLSGARPLSELRPHPPVASRQVFCAGANYTKHVRQIAFTSVRNDPANAGRSDEELHEVAEEILRDRIASGIPFVFSAPTGALCGAHDDVVLWGPGTQHDWELELAVVIGRYASDVPADRAMDYVAGFTISNDVTVRDQLVRPVFPMTDFVMGKCRPTFFPTGPYLMPTEFVPDYRKLSIQLAVNGEVMQDEIVDDIIYGVEELIAYVSSVVELAPGDLLLTGSPAGNAGHHGNRWLVPGDLMEATITGLGIQRNRAVADPRTGREPSSSISSDKGVV
jgi:2,4-diketo-3-deoxy-L-fuconate hydrolase